MDLNPLSTPSNVLTDCINGTFITYNGNEFSLQNDQGNIKLQYCKLKPNYIPVGIKEHGDILYIVSYNPLDKKVEIGSYPSPLQVSESDKDNNIDIKSIIKENLIDSGTFEGNYSELITKEKQIIFNGDDYKLYPGDSYKLEIEEEFPYKYETLEYFILDEDSNIHDISEEIVKNENDFSYISWDVPGWIVSKIRLAKLAFAGLNVRSFYAPETSGGRDIYYEFNIRLNIEDRILKNVIKDYESNKIDKSEILFDISFSGKNGKDYPKHLNKSITNITDWYKDNKIVWEKVDGKFSTTKDDVITVELVPKLVEFDESGNILYTIVYDNLKQIQEFDLSKINDKAFGISDDFYKFYQTNDKEQVLEFDVSGPLITTSVIDLYYNIYSIDNQNGSPILRNKVNDYSGIGMNWIVIPFNDVFQKEDIYTIEFEFIGSDSNFKSSRRLLITTELLNGTERVQVYDKDLTMNYIVEKYKENIVKKFIDPTLTIVEERFNNKIDIEHYSKISSEYCSDRTFNTFIPSEEEFNSFDVNVGVSGKQIVDINKCEYLHGKLWDNFIEEVLTYGDSQINTNSHVELDVRNGILLNGSTKPLETISFYRDLSGYDLTTSWLHTLNVTHEAGGLFKDNYFKFDWGDRVKEYYYESLGDMIARQELRYPFKTKQYYLCKLIKVPFWIHSQETLSKYILVFDSNRYFMFSFDILSCFIQDENKENLNLILKHLYITRDNVSFSDHISYSTDFTEIFKGISYELKTTYNFEKWNYLGYNLNELLTKSDVKFVPTLYTKSDKLTFFSKYEYERDFPDTIYKEIELLKNRTSLQHCSKEMKLWKEQHLSVNSTHKTGAGVYCNSYNENLIKLARSLDSYYLDNKRIGVNINNPESYSNLSWFGDVPVAPISILLGNASEFLESSEYISNESNESM